MNTSHLILSSFLAVTVICSSDTTLAQSNRRPVGEKVAQILAGVDEDIVKQFGKAWSDSRLGNNRPEAVVLIYRLTDGRYRGEFHGGTNEYGQSTFKWVRSAVAIVHTHPQCFSPEPTAQDRRVAEKLGVPIFTITAKGMYVYDPATREISLVQEYLDWIDPSKWKAGSFGIAVR
ncbi:MAG TPA: hypothetical protein VLG74_12620 [Blastocatellia bacterium]|nr:hypothetical protein [Blastocatellia bacterium]